MESSSPVPFKGADPLVDSEERQRHEERERLLNSIEDPEVLRVITVRLKRSLHGRIFNRARDARIAVASIKSETFSMNEWCVAALNLALGKPEELKPYLQDIVDDRNKKRR